VQGAEYYDDHQGSEPDPEPDRELKKRERERAAATAGSSQPVKPPFRNTRLIP